MKRILVYCEGPSEKTFVNRIILKRLSRMILRRLILFPIWFYMNLKPYCFPSQNILTTVIYPIKQ